MSDTHGRGSADGRTGGDSEGSSTLTSKLISLQALASELLDAASPEEVDLVVRRLASSIVGATDARLVRGLPGAAGSADVPASVDDGQVWILIEREDEQHDALMVGFASPTSLAPADIELLRLEGTMAARSLDRLAAIEEERGLRERSEVLQHLAVEFANARDPGDVARALIDVLIKAGVAAAEVSIAGDYTGAVSRAFIDEPRDQLLDVVLDVGIEVELDPDIEVGVEPGTEDDPTGRLQVTVPDGTQLDPRHEAFWQAVVEVTGDAIARVRRFAELEDLARNDPLTGLPNRRVFDEYLRLALARLQRADDPLAVFFIDLDRLKEVNDRFGHHVGDELLVRVGDILSDVLRPTDLAARLGGDEFAVLAEAVGGEAGAQALAERIRSSITGQLGAIIGYEVTASVGYAWTLRADEDPDELLAHADDAMYAEKRARREL